MSLWKLRHQFSDLTIVCDNGKSILTVHKVVLAAVCPALASQLDTTNTLHLPDLSSSEVGLVLESAYNGCPDAAAKLQVILAQSVSAKNSQPSISEPKTTHLCLLPTEILCHILSYLPTRDVLANVALISTRFYDLSKDPSVHKVVKVQMQFSPSLFNFLKSASQMQELYLVMKHHGQQIDGLLSFITNHSKLSVLWVENPICLTWETFVHLQNSQWWPSLTKLNLSFEEDELFKCFFFTQSFDKALASLGANGTMTHLGADCKVLSKVTGPAFEKLRSITIWGPFDGDLLKVAVLPRKETLEKLEIRAIDYWYKEESSYDFLVELPRLTSFKIEMLHFGHSLHFLAKLQQLKKLDIISDDNWDDCYIPPMCLPNLTSLKVKTHPECKECVYEPKQVCIIG